jgi:cyclic pyranopterin phosphate synthase
MDKYRIDSHKYAFHPQHSSTILDYLGDRKDIAVRSRYKHQHPLYIEVSPVGACNHRCTFCAVDYIGYKSIFMDINAYKRSLDSMRNKGCKSIMFAGEGEPLLHPNINEFVNFTKEELDIDVAFTTNAFRLSEKFVAECLKNISWIKVSFNGGNPSTYASIHQTSETDFEVVSNHIRFANRYRLENGINCAIGLQTLLLPENVDTIPELCEHAIDLGADYIVIKPYSQHKYSDTVIYKDIDYSQYLDLGDKLKCYNSESFNVIFRINTIKNWMSQNDQRYCKCLATPSTWAYWMANGDVYSCSAYLLDDRFKLGNINEASFDDVWVSDRRMDHLDFVLDELDISECRVNCRMDQVNRYLDNIYTKDVAHLNFI